MLIKILKLAEKEKTPMSITDSKWLSIDKNTEEIIADVLGVETYR